MQGAFIAIDFGDRLAGDIGLVTPTVANEKGAEKLPETCLSI